MRETNRSVEMAIPDVDSSWVDDVFYAPYPKRVLTIRTGTVRYMYHNVPRRIFRGLLKADSVGEYINQYVKPAYSCTKAGLFS